jgi:hypothetical protein
MRNDSHAAHGHGPSLDILDQMGYETRDVSLPGLIKWLSFFGVFLVIATVGSKFLYDALVPNFAAEQSNSPMMHVRHVPPFPQIQAEPIRDMVNYRTAEDEVLAGNPAVGSKTGMSVDAAIDAIATQRGIAGVKGDSIATPDPNSKSYPARMEAPTGAASLKGSTP